MIAFKLLISILIPTFIGFSVMLCLFYKEKISFLLMLALSYGLGLGLLTLWMLALNFVQVKMNFATTALPLSSLSLILLFIYYLKLSPATSTKHQPFAKISFNKNMFSFSQVFLFISYAFCIFFIIQNIFLVFNRTLNLPIYTYDALSTIAFKAKIFYFSESIPKLSYLPHGSYPLLTPLSEAWIAFTMSRWSDIFVKIIFPATLLSYLTIQYKFVSDMANRFWGLFSCVLLLSSNFFIMHATISYRDFMLTYYNCTTLMLLLLWHKGHNHSFLILASLFAGITTFVKLEGTTYLLVYIIIFAILNFTQLTLSKKEKWRNFFKFTVPSMTICLTYHIYRMLNSGREGEGVDSKTKIDFTLEKLSRIPEIWSAFMKNFFLSGNWSLIWFLLALSLVHLFNKKNHTYAYLLLLSITLYFGIYFATALFTVNFHWIAGKASVTTLSRLILHFFPLAVITTALLNKR